MRARTSTLVLSFAAVAVGPACRRPAMPPRPDGAAVVVAPGTPSSEADVPFAAEVEPNDTLATAQRLELASATAPVRGVNASVHEGQGKSRDTDLFRVDVAAADAGMPPTAPAADGGGASPPAVVRRSLRVDVRPDGLVAVVLDALDDQGQTLVSTGAGQAGEALAIPSLAVTAGTYYLRVRGATPSGSGGAAGAPTAGAYRLVARLAPLEAGAEIEPNGKATLATDLAPDGEAVGHLGWRRDQDWYRVPVAGLADGSVLSADLDPVPGVTASLLVYDSVEQKLTESRGRKEERVALRNVRLPAGEPHVFVVVRADAGWSGEGRYDLRLRSEIPRAGGETEPNDDAAHAQPITDGTLVGYLGRGDVDMFRYSPPGPVELDVEVAPPERVDAALEIVSPAGAILARSDTGKRHEPERIPNLFVEGGPSGYVFIRLSAGKGDGNPDEPYRLTVTSRPPDPGAEREPNDALVKPTVLAAGGHGNGLIAPRGDVDFWQVAATPDADGNVALAVTGVPGLTLDVRVHAQSGRDLGRFKVAPGAEATNRVSAGGEACCIVEVREASGRASNPRDRYSLAVGP
jgi:hypothetical protein